MPVLTFISRVTHELHGSEQLTRLRNVADLYGSCSFITLLTAA